MLTDTQWDRPLAISHLKLFLRTRVWFDTTAAADGNIPEYDAFPNRFRRDGFYGQAAGDIASFQLWEAWLDYNYGDFWVRLGRQNIVRGDVSPARLLDDVNPLDVSWHLVLEPLGKDVFDHLRIPLWAIRGAYQLPFSLGAILNEGGHIEGYIAPPFAFTANQIPGQGDVGAPDANGNFPIGRYPSPLNVIPPFLKVSRNPSDGMKGVSVGTRIVATAFDGRLNYTLNFLSRRNVEGLAKGVGLTPDFNGFSPIVIPGIGPSILFLENVHPRFQTAGFSLNYFEQFTKTVTRVEAVWDFNRPYELVPFSKRGSPDEITPRHTWSYVIAVDRPTFVIRKGRAMLLSAQFEHRIREGGAGILSSAGSRVPLESHIITVIMGQALPGFYGRFDEFFVDLALLADLDDSFAIVPLFRWEPGNHWRFNAWYNVFLGPQAHATTNANPGGFGGLTWAQGLNLSVSYVY